MNFVEPIRDRKKIAQIKNQLRGQRHHRDQLLFVVGINPAMRISDLMELQVEYFLDDNRHIKRRFLIKEQKRGSLPFSGKLRQSEIASPLRDLQVVKNSTCEQRESYVHYDQITMKRVVEGTIRLHRS